MHFLHPSSADCCKSEVDLFSVNPTQTSIGESTFISVNPINSITNTNVPLEFLIPGTSDQYLDPANVFLHMTVKLTNADGSDLTGTDHVVYPETNFLYTCFSEIEVFLNETSLGASAASYPYRCYIENLLNFSADAKDSHLQSIGYYKLQDVVKVVDDYKKRQSKTLDFYGRLQGDIFAQDRLILPGVDTRIRMTRSTPSFMLNVATEDGITSEPPKPVVQLLDAYLHVRKVRLNPQTHLDIERTLLTTSAKYPIKRIETKVFNFTKGLTNINIPNVVLGNLPQKVILGIVGHDAFSGNYSRSPFKFSPFGLRNLSVAVDGRVYGRPYDMVYNGAESLCSRPFRDLIGNTVSCCDIGTGINLESFATDTNLYGYDLTPDLTASSAYHFNIVKQGTLGFNLTFDKPLATSISVIIYLEYSQIVEIDRVRNVLVNF